MRQTAGIAVADPSLSIALTLSALQDGTPLPVGYSSTSQTPTLIGDIDEHATQDSLSDGDRAYLRDRITRATGKD